jgi:hypothetical protein
MPVVGVIVYIGLVVALGIVTSLVCVIFRDYVASRRAKPGLRIDR